jgi:hypothetical protein
VGGHGARSRRSGRRERSALRRAKALVFEPPLPVILPKLARLLLATHGRDPSMTAAAMARRSGAYRVNRLRDGFVDFAAFEATEHYDLYYRRVKVSDRLYIGYPVSPMAEYLRQAAAGRLLLASGG